RDGCPEQDHQSKQAPALPTAPAGDMKRCPFEEARFIKQQTDDDYGDESRGSVPDDVPHHRHIPQTHDASQ
nr:hypothetical protein [Tanacetum cinerariifolium]